MEPRYPEEAEVRRQVASQIFRRRRETKTRGDDLVARYDSAGGDSLARQMELDLAGAIATTFKGTPEDLCRQVRHRVPSAKPCRMQVQGMKSPETRQQLRTGDIDNWGHRKLLAVAAALGAKGVRIELVW